MAIQLTTTILCIENCYSDIFPEHVFQEIKAKKKQKKIIDHKNIMGKYGRYFIYVDN